MNRAQQAVRQFPLKISLGAMSDRTRALIEYYIEHTKDRILTLAESADAADALIVDYDHAARDSDSTTNEWLIEAACGRALIVLAAQKPEIEDGIVLSKPLDSASLEKAAETVLDRLVNPELHSDAGAEDLSDVARVDANQEARTGQEVLASPGIKPLESTPPYFRTSDAVAIGPQTLPMIARIERYQAKVDLLCGAPRTLADLSDRYNEDHRYDPSRCLSHHVAPLIFNSDEDLKAARLSLPDAELFVLPTLNKVYTSISLTRSIRHQDSTSMPTHFAGLVRYLAHRGACPLGLT